MDIYISFHPVQHLLQRVIFPLITFILKRYLKTDDVSDTCCKLWHKKDWRVFRKVGPIDGSGYVQVCGYIWGYEM